MSNLFIVKIIISGIVIITMFNIVISNNPASNNNTSIIEVIGVIG